MRLTEYETAKRMAMTYLIIFIVGPIAGALAFLAGFMGWY